MRNHFAAVCRQKQQGTIQTLEQGGEQPVLSDQEYEDVQIINIGADGDENEEARFEQDQHFQEEHLPPPKNSE